MPGAADPTVVFALTGDVRRNSRALRQLRALSAHGAAVEVLTLGPPALDAAPLAPGIRLRVLPTPAGSGPRFFARVHRLFAGAARRLPADVYHASDLYTLPAMAAAARRHGARLAYDARECYPHVAATAGRPWVRRFWQAVEGRFIRRADAVFTVSPSIAAHLQRTYGIAAPVVLYNAPPQREVSPLPFLRDAVGAAPESVLVLHQGQMRADRGCERLVDALRDVQGAVLVFLGGGPLQPALEQQAARGGLGNRVHFVPPVPPDDLLPVTAGADIGVTLLEDTCLNHRYALPNKLFEYLTAGVPVLASDLPELRNVVSGYDVGCVADPANRQALVGTLQRMVDDAAARARWAAHAPRALETFGWEKSSQLFLRLYDTLLAPSSR